jgi:hypothetical protein
MSQENVELVRQFLATFIEVDEGLVGQDRLHEFTASDAVIEIRDVPDLCGERRGLTTEEFIEWRAEFAEAYDDWDYSAESVLDAGANVVVTEEALEAAGLSD